MHSERPYFGDSRLESYQDSKLSLDNDLRQRAKAHAVAKTKSNIVNQHSFKFQVQFFSSIYAGSATAFLCVFVRTQNSTMTFHLKADPNLRVLICQNQKK